MSSKREIWNQIVNRLQSILTDSEFNTWFSQTSLKDFAFDRAIIGVPNKFVGNWLEERYLPDIKTAFKTVLRQAPEIRFSCDSGTPGPEESTQTPANGNTLASYYRLNLNPSMTFQQFIIGDCNRFAYTSALEVSKRPSYYYNPLYIYSESGLGKTHLLHAIGNCIVTEDPSCRIRYLSSDSFTSDFVYSIKNDKLHEFRQKYCNTDVLLFDDIHLLANRKRTQDEFLFVFNTLLDEKKQIVISGNSAPNRLKHTNSQLISRLGGGLLTEILPPDNKIKIKIIKTRAEEDNIHIPDDVLFFFANSTDSIKSLANTMVRFEAFASLNAGDINISVAKSLIKDVNRTGVGIEDIKTAVSNYFNMSPKDLTSNKKKRAYSYPRQLAMYLTRKYTSLSYQQIGDAFGRKNHSTVIYAIKRIEKGRADGKEIQGHLEKIENLIS